ncbi:MAG: lipid-binding SYLF domain-containing protein [Syntrophobacteraceae bacterium]|nr:lipid-binding SYLF domain-containing protein [Desulfobacteraceae bacterium]
MRKKCLLFAILAAGALSFFAAGSCIGGSDEESTVQSATQVMSEIMSIPEQSIPPSLLGEAYGIAIFPGLLKAGFILGARYGQGVMVVRSKERGWSNPVFFTITGGSVGWQIGAQSTDAILVFRTMRSLDAITSGKFTLGADASVAAGPVGRHAEAGTDIQLKSEILSYSRNRGLFAGVALEGAAMQVDYKANSAFYSMAGLLPMQIFMSAELQAPWVADDLKRVLARYSTQ